MDSNALSRKLPLDFFLLVYALSVPFWLFGGDELPLPMKLPASALMWINPALAAAILTYRTGDREGVKRLLRKALDYRKITDRTWCLAVLGVVPAIYGVTYLLMRVLDLPLPESIDVPILMAPVLFLLFVIPAAGEELGWSGYAIGPMQDRWGALRASIILGIVWQVWHIIPDLQGGHSATWILWHALYSIALRVLIVWSFNNTGQSVFAAILAHTMDNVSWSLFPNDGSHLDPFVLAVVAWLTVLVILVGWEPSTLTRRRHTGTHHARP